MTEAPRRRRFAGLVGLLTTLVILGLAGWFWQRSLLPGTYSVMDMGHADYGGGAVPAAAMGHGSAHAGMPMTSVADLQGPTGTPDVAMTLTARAEQVRLMGSQPSTVSGFTLNGTSPGPQITAREGQLVAVTLVNESVPDGVTLHWHGVDVPNAEDGVAGVTQDAVTRGQSHTYRFVARDPGTYWYHSHQVSDAQVKKGLFGGLVIVPKAPQPTRDAVALVHSYGGHRTVNGTTGVVRVPAAPGEQVRLRVVNTNNGPLPLPVTGGAGYRVLAVDGRDVHEPGPLTAERVKLAAGGRADLLLTGPSDGTAQAVDLGGGSVVAVGGPDARIAPTPAAGPEVDLLRYGTPAPLAFDPNRPTRRFEYAIGRRPGLFDGKPGLWWTINGHQFPDVPMFTVEQGDVVQMTLRNSSGQLHPMHLHGHHAVVLSRNGVAAIGSPWLVDSLDVASGDSYVIAFLADNPGVWADHCHNLPHASQGLITHLMYAGVTTPYRIGGGAKNDPE